MCGWQMAKAAQDSGKQQHAYKLYTHLSKLDLSSMEEQYMVYNSRGMLAQKHGDQLQALYDLTIASSLKPDQWQPLMARSAFYQALHHDSTAAEVSHLGLIHALPPAHGMTVHAGGIWCRYCLNGYVSGMLRQYTVRGVLTTVFRGKTGLGPCTYLIMSWKASVVFMMTMRGMTGIIAATAVASTVTVHCRSSCQQL